MWRLLGHNEDGIDLGYWREKFEREKKKRINVEIPTMGNLSIEDAGNWTGAKGVRIEAAIFDLVHAHTHARARTHAHTEALTHTLMDRHA